MAINCSIGITAYNEGANLGPLLNSVLAQRLSNIYIKEIFIVASGCVDDTAEVATCFLKQDERIKILLQQKRKGKASAINLFLKNCSTDIVVILNADLMLKDDTIQHLLQPFFETKIGMTGGRALPINNIDTFMGFVAHFLWQMHHEISLKFPKLGELIAYRKFKDLNFPIDTVDDEGIIESIMKKKGFCLKYVPEAEFNNKGPLYISEFIRRRRNIFAGHLQLRHRTSYAVSTMNLRTLLIGLFLKIVKTAFKNWRYFFWTVAVILFESFARILASYDFYILKRDHRIWKKAESEQNLSYAKTYIKHPSI